MGITRTALLMLDNNEPLMDYNDEVQRVTVEISKNHTSTEESRSACRRVDWTKSHHDSPTNRMPS